MEKRVKTAFFGTPDIAVPALKALVETTDVRGVVCQPDRPAGRGLQLSACAVKLAALELGLEVHQPVKVKTGNLDEWLRAHEVEAALVIAYGRILPPAVLEVPRFGCINLHASLLPKYRGAAPINWVLINGETETGISLMRMDEGLDTGPVFSQHRLSLTPQPNAGELARRMSALAAEIVRLDLPKVFAGLEPIPQDPGLATHAPPLHGPDCQLDFTQSSSALVNRILGLSPRPGAFTTLGAKRLKILNAETTEFTDHGAEPGEIVRAERDCILVKSGDGLVRIVEAQLEGRKALGAGDLVQGRAVSRGQRLGA
ncbi:MAG: High confidence in function and specificity [Pseudomonadota bacterium]